MLSLFVVISLGIAAAFDGVYREEGDSCGPSNKWTCRKFDECNTAIADLDVDEDAFPETCSISNGATIVCCRPDGDNPTPKVSIASKMCEKYASYVFRRKITGFNGGKPVFSYLDECGAKEEPLIVGGSKAGLKEFPHMAQIGYKKDGQVHWLCGGSLISDQWVLSAAHCTKAPENLGNAVLVRLGELDTSTNLDGAQPKTFEIVERINHPDWNGDHLYNDIALYKLNATVELDSFIRPICLQVDEIKNLSSGLASGWGHQKWEGESTAMLQKVWISMLNMKQCKRSYGIKAQLPKGILEDRMLCTFGQGKNDTCQGDSGGPLQIPVLKPYCMYKQIAVTSFGVKCAHVYPSVYTKVSFYVPWIESIVWPNES